MSLGTRTLLHHLRTAVVTFAVVAVGLLAVTTGPTPRDEQPTNISPAGELIQRHHCWTGTAPADVTIPGHVVATTPGAGTIYGGPHHVRKALEQTFDGINHGYTVHAFCR